MKKRILFPAVTLAILVGLFYLEFRTWKRFEWKVFREQSGQVHVLPVLGAVALIYVVYYLRALRWRTFLAPMSRASAWLKTCSVDPKRALVYCGCSVPLRSRT